MASVLRFDEWQDSDGNAVASGTGGVFSAPGSIVQVEGASRTTTFSSSSTSYVDLTDVTVTLTPASASSKFVVILNVPYARGSTASFWYAQVDRNGSALNVPAIQGDANYYDGGLNVAFLDSPATTSPVTYKAQVKVSTGTGLWGGGNITVMEVAG